ncbi:MAG: hypothetical protein C0483_26110 [Pirellula sp.]|nr:hypothetical protein [Pirellula sp.]
MLTVRIVLQARMGSLRRPGKTVADIAGRTLLARCVERLTAARNLGARTMPQARWELVVATSRLSADEPIARAAEAMGCGCVRGSESDVFARYLTSTCELNNADVVIRATADNPLYCPERTVRLVEHHLLSGAVYSGIAEALSPSVPEVFRVGALRAASLRSDLDAYCREHVTPCFRRDGSPFRRELLTPTWAGLDPDLRLTVDTPADLSNMNALYNALISLTGADEPASWSLAQIYGTARGLEAARAAEHSDASIAGDLPAASNRSLAPAA